MARYSWKDFCERVQGKSISKVDIWEYIGRTDDKEYPPVVIENSRKQEYYDQDFKGRL